MEQAATGARSIHDAVLEQTRGFHEQLHQIDAQIGELQMQRAVVLAVARIELKRSAELKEAAGGAHDALVDGLLA